jgi:hypothetical protein
MLGRIAFATAALLGIAITAIAAGGKLPNEFDSHDASWLYL